MNDRFILNQNEANTYHLLSCNHRRQVGKKRKRTKLNNKKI
jgi:hypothetical protein